MSDASRPYVFVVGIDYSETGELALERALQMASEKPNAELYVVNVLEPTPEDSWKDVSPLRLEAEFLPLEELWCEQHRERHGQRHTYRQGDRLSGETNMPLVFHS